MVWRTIVTRDREVVEARVRSEHQGPSPGLAAALASWPGTHYWAQEDGEPRLVLIRVLDPPPRERWWLHGALFVVTFLTVAAGGSLVASHPVASPFALRWDALGGTLFAGLRALGEGRDFAMALMAILLTHECGHYFAAQRYRINASPPYFLPAPWMLNFIGTFGAFIRLRSPIADRRQLMDVGAAGPWAGFVLAVVLLLFGLSRSHLAAVPVDSPFVVFFQGSPVHWGDSLITYAARHWLLGDGTVVMHPLALAGWFGIFVTMLNLLPLGQLDGGHILYALIGDGQRLVGNVMWLALLPLGHWFWGWWVWAALILIFSRGRIAHPSVLDRHRAIPPSRRWLGWATVALFVVTFTPVPFHL